MIIRRFAVSFLLALGASAAVKSDMLVSPEWLAQHLNDPGLVILHVSANRTAYDAGHIPGARFVSQGGLAVTNNGVPNELPPVADLQKLFEAAGVSNNSRVIVYSDGSVLPATRAYFTLDYLGLGERAALLDGGLQRWRTENRTVTQQGPTVAAGSITPKVRAELVVSTAEVKQLSESAARDRATAPATLVDVRSAADFRGEKGDHIPGSVNTFWQDSQASANDPSLKQEQVIRELFNAAGITPAKSAIVYCNSGMQATQSYFTLKYLGYQPRLYDGSMSEWKSASLPVEK